MLNGQSRKTKLTKDPGITTRQLIRFFNPKLWGPYDNSSKVRFFHIILIFAYTLLGILHYYWSFI